MQAFGRYWTHLPADEAAAVARMVVERAVSEPDTATSAGSMNQVEFTSPSVRTYSYVRRWFAADLKRVTGIGV